MGWPEAEAVIAPLATNSKLGVVRISKVELLGYAGKVQWKQDESGLKVQLPAEKPVDHAIVFKITSL